MESFYTSQFAIVFNIEENGDIQGIFTTVEHDAPRQEFWGISSNCDQISICFTTNWNAYPQIKLEFQTTFCGTVDNDRLHLKWIHTVNELFHGQGSATLYRTVETRTAKEDEIEGLTILPFERLVDPALN